MASSEAEIAQRTREGPSSEAEIGYLLEGNVNGPHAGLLGVLSFLPNGKQAVGLCGPSYFNMCFAFFKVILVPRLGCP